MDEPQLIAQRNPSAHRGATDDAGERIRGIDLSDLPISEGDAGKPMQRFVKQLRVAARHEGGLSGRGQLLVLGLTIAVLMGWGAVQARGAVPQLLSVPAFFAVVVLGVGLSWAITRRVGLRVRRGGIARAIAARGFCGGCGYDLRDAAERRPRFVECPECAARWSPDRLLSAPLGAMAWDTLGSRRGRVPASRRLAVDDRGAILRRIRSVPWRAPKAARRAWSADQRRAMWRARLRSGLIWRILTSLVGLVLLALAGYLTLLATNQLAAAWWLVLALNSGAFGALIVVTTCVGETGVSNTRFASAVRDAGACAACAASIRDARVDADGFCVCTSCGSSWKPSATPSDAGVEPQPADATLQA